ncbi:hypothetical protein ACFL3T_00245 [Patescibacteria group bacterium]
MKKLLTTLLVLTGMFIAGTMIGTATAASSTDTLEKDMYMRIYEEVTKKPAEEAAKASASKFGMSEDNMKKVVNEGEVSSLIDKKDKNQTQAELVNKYSKVFADYQSSLDTENMRSDLMKKANPSEIYTDGDTSNSEFDILYDLTVIEVILFNEASVSEFGGQFALPDFDFTDPNEKALIDELFGREVEEEKVGATESTETKDFSSIECLDDDSNLEDALNAFDSEQGAGTGEDGDGQGTGEDEGVVYDEDGFPQAEPDPWPTNFLCPDGAFFCIEISFSDETTKIYSKKDNCVACHIQNINKTMDSMLNKSLTANKMPGNLMEAPKCKSSFSNVGANMNIITIAVPPPKQAKQDLYLKLNVEKEWLKFKQQADPNYFDTGANPQPTQTSVEDRASRKGLANSGPNATFEEVVKRTTEISNGVINRENENRASKPRELKTEVQNKEFQNVIEEMSAFKLYFSSIKELFEKMKEPCTELSNKSYCS